MIHFLQVSWQLSLKHWFLPRNAMNSRSPSWESRKFECLYFNHWICRKWSIIRYLIIWWYVALLNKYHDFLWCTWTVYSWYILASWVRYFCNVNLCSSAVFCFWGPSAARSPLYFTLWGLLAASPVGMCSPWRSIRKWKSSQFFSTLLSFYWPLASLAFPSETLSLSAWKSAMEAEVIPEWTKQNSK